MVSDLVDQVGEYIRPSIMQLSLPRRSTSISATVCDICWRLKSRLSMSTYIRARGVKSGDRVDAEL